jgi:hypothetical protein
LWEASQFHNALGVAFADNVVPPSTGSHFLSKAKGAQTMTDSIGDSNTSSEADEEAGKFDHEQLREYLPMNVFVDPATIKARFQCSPGHAVLAGVHSTA